MDPIIRTTGIDGKVGVNWRLKQIHSLAIAFRNIAEQDIEISTATENGDELAHWAKLKNECDAVIDGVTLF